MPFPMQNGRYIQRYDRYYRDPLETFDPRVPPFKVTQGYRNRHDFRTSY